MIPLNRIPSSPRIVFKHEFYIPSGLGLARFSRAYGVSQRWLKRMLSGRGGIVLEEAVVLAKITGTSIGFWMGLDTNYRLGWVRVAAGRRGMR